jgi:hypothetical protein
MDFPSDSTAAQVLSGARNSPAFKPKNAQKHDADKANKEQDRGKDRGVRPYGSYIVFRLNSKAVLSIDWPMEIESATDDPYITAMRRLLTLDVAPAIGAPSRRFLIVTELNDPSKVVLRQTATSTGP